MRKNFGSKPWLYPMPVFIVGTYDKNGKPNAMNAAWGGMADTSLISLCLGSHRTTDNLRETKAFTVSIGTADQVTACDYVGLVSQKADETKLNKTGWTVTKAEHVNAPLFDQLPMALECTVKSYDEETGLLLGNIVNVCADESVLTDGKIDPAKLRPVTFDPVGNHYYALGEVVGNAFSDGKKCR